MFRTFRCSTAAMVLIAVSLGTCISAAAADPSAISLAPAALQFLQKHCQSCHSGEKPKGDFAIASLGPDFADKEVRLRWLDVAEQLKSGEMPPKEKPRPGAEETQALLAWIGQQVAAAESAKDPNQGRVVLRRLNRVEYQNTIRDLLAVDVDLRDLLPIETAPGGFDNNAELLHVSSFLMENYLEAADRVLDAAIASGGKPNVMNKRFSIKDEKSIKPTGSVYRHEEDGVAIFASWVSANIQVTMWNFRTPERGKYRVKMSGYGYQTNKPVTFHVLSGPLNAMAQQLLVGYFEVPPEKPTVIEFVEQLEANRTFRIVTDALGALPPDVQKVGAENYKGPGLLLQWVDIEGPLVEAWPPKGHQLLFGDLPQETVRTPGGSSRREVVSKQPMVDAEQILHDFARRAFRRDVTAAELKPFLSRVKTKLDGGASFEQAVRVGLRAVLISPNFLFLRERAASGSETRAAGKPAANDHSTNKQLDDFALASRLSYFLWSSMPDEELLKLAEQKKLHEPETLRGQVERMLEDPRAAAFADNFVGQWLSLRQIDATMPERMLYPEYDDILKVAMLQEVNLFFAEVLKSDLSLTNFVASDFTYLNGPLAKLYNIPDVQGLESRKVKLPEGCHRGGVMTMAAVLKVTANGTTTSPILRGAWVLDRILGTPPPKPTVDVEAVEPDIRGATTIRNQLAKHRSNGECASCHAKIDPPGFALESFDVIGGWREHYRKLNEGEPIVRYGRRTRYLDGPPVDPADVLPDGRKFQNIDEFKQLLLEDKDQLARALAGKLVAYGTGAAPTVEDREQVEAIVKKSRESNYGFRSLIHEVVQSEIFRSR